MTVCLQQRSKPATTKERRSFVFEMSASYTWACGKTSSRRRGSRTSSYGCSHGAGREAQARAHWRRTDAEQGYREGNEMESSPGGWWRRNSARGSVKAPWKKMTAVVTVAAAR
jgi:hypothetical protein